MDDDVNLDEDELETENKLSSLFYNLPRKSREKIQKKIPLKILKRFKEVNSKKPGDLIKIMKMK